MRIIAALITISIAAPTYAVNDECPEPNQSVLGEGRKTWEQHSTVYYAFDPATTTPQLRLNAGYAFEEWTKQLEGPTRLNVRFVNANGMHEPHITIRGATLPAGTYGQHTPTGWYTSNNRLARAEIEIDMKKFDMAAPDFFGAIEKVMLHEIGHSLGLDHPREPEAGGSIMNVFRGGDPNDHEFNFVPTAPTTCDKNRVNQWGDLVTDGGGGNRRQRPPHMSADYCSRCGEFGIDVWIADDRLPDGGRFDRIYVDAWCCGHNSLNAFPRPAGGPSWAFLGTGYQCSDDGWRQVNRGCYADLCCVHPDDYPEGPPVLSGTTCAAQGWWEADAKTACELSIGNQAACVKKEVCGTGQCQPWPNYCWKPPYVPGGGGGGGGDDGGGGDPPPGVSCSSKGWYDGDDLSGCERDHGSCERKADCDGQQCLPDPPGYCWRP